ncbi:MAG: hypothetical protein HRT61_01785 [Ekhidna sp.]|nr:hypothetical protein [Ekhidna sp.]
MKFFLFALLLITYCSVFSQEDYLVTFEGDTLTGKINFRRENVFDLASIKTSNGRKEFRSYQTRSAKKGEKIYLPLVYQNRNVFGEVISNDIIGRFYVMAEGGNQFRDEILVKRDKSTMSFTSLGLRKRLAAFLSDCPFVVKKLEKKEIQASDIETVISIYKEQCSNQSSLLKAQVETDNELFEFAQLIIDIQQKLDADQDIPKYMIDALRRTEIQGLENKIDKLLSQLDN